ncbi:MAG: hypothetical protein HY367_04360 [Candidatus Aenigmarchaeota archaeon]|nr:hypothetical protein [Candidatus Aenigmarchaeota archaeon]
MAFGSAVPYKRREFCNGVECPVQVEMNRVVEGSEEYETLRLNCKHHCLFTAHDFHKWLTEHGFIIIKKPTGSEGGRQEAKA